MERTNLPKKSYRLSINQKFVKRPVWISLSGTAKSVYLLFRCKCQMAKPTRRYDDWVVLNNGELVFTYKEAERDYGITRPRFVRAIDELVGKGFIDIAQTGMGVHKATTLYGISDRWRLYGRADFIVAKRPKSNIPNQGFKKGHKMKTRKLQVTKTLPAKALASNENVTGDKLASNENVTGQKVVNIHRWRRDKMLGGQIA